MRKRNYFKLIFVIVSFLIIAAVLFYYLDNRVVLSPGEGGNLGGSLYYSEGQDYVILGNSKVEFTFNGTSNGNVSISQLKNVETNRIFQTNNDELFKVSLQNGLVKGEYFLSDLNYQFSYYALPETPGPGKTTLIFNWDNATVRGLDSTQVINISASIVLGMEENIAEFWINMTTQMDEYSIYKVTYPIVNILGFADPSKEAVVLPWLMGTLIVNPRVDLIDKLREITSNNELNEILYTGITNSYYYSYQFSAYYDLDTLDLFYFGTKDPYEYYKKIVWNLSTQGAGFSVVQFPEDHLTPNIDYSSPYPVVMGMLKGDWYDAAKYYRSWSVESFAKRGKLENAGGISSVFHDLDFKLSLSMPNSLDSFRKNYTNGINESEDFKDYFNECPDAYMPFYSCNPDFKFENATIEVYEWQNGTTFSIQEGWPADYKPIHPAVMELVKRSHENGDIVIPYTIQVNFDVNSSSYNETIESYAVVDENGNVVKNVNMYSPGRLITSIDPNTTFWQNYVSNIMVDHLDFGDDNLTYSGVGFDGAYWDVWSGVEAVLDYSNRGDHPKGGGNWWHGGEENLVDLSRQRASELNPKWILESEHATELYIDDLEFVQWNFPGSSAPLYDIPIYATLFHDYVGISSIIETWPKISTIYPNQNFNRFFQAIYMSYGLFPGVSNGKINEVLTFPLLEGDYEFFSFVKQYVRSYSFAKKYLLYGERMRVPEFSTDSYSGFSSPSIFFNGYYPGAPKVMLSMWKANDGTLGLLLVNWWNETEQVNFTINFSDYGLSYGSNYYLTKMDEVNPQLLGQYSNDFNYGLNVPAASLYVISLSSNQLSNGSSTNTGGGGGGGGSGGGGGGGGPPGVLTQCSDRIDNDVDGFIDYPYDSGCLNKQDNTEIDSSVLNNTNNYQNETNSSINNDIEEEAFKLKIFFVLALGVLILGILVVAVLIVRSYRHRARFSQLNQQLQTSYNIRS